MNLRHPRRRSYRRSPLNIQSHPMIDHDKKGHVFVHVGNIRVTYVPAADRRRVANWARSDVLRVQAYRRRASSSLHRGAEFPVRDPDAMVQLIAALCEAYSQGRKAALPNTALAAVGRQRSN